MAGFIINLKDGSEVIGLITHDVSFKTAHGTLKVKNDNIRAYSSSRGMLTLDNFSELRGEIQEECIVIDTKYGELKVQIWDIYSMRAL